MCLHETGYDVKDNRLEIWKIIKHVWISNAASIKSPHITKVHYELCFEGNLSCRTNTSVELAIDCIKEMDTVARWFKDCYAKCYIFLHAVKEVTIFGIWRSDVYTSGRSSKTTLRHTLLCGQFFY